MTFEERIKMVLGDLHFALLVQSQQNEELRAKLAQQAEANTAAKAQQEPTP